MVSMGGASASPNSPPSPESPASPVRNLAVAIGQDRIPLPPAVIISRTFSEEGGEPVEMATAITFDRLTFTIEEAVRLGVLTRMAGSTTPEPRCCYTLRQRRAHGSARGRPGLCQRSDRGCDMATKPATKEIVLEMLGWPVDGSRPPIDF